MRNKHFFTLAGVGILFGLFSAYVSANRKRSQPPVFDPAPNPYAKGIYATASSRAISRRGANVNIYPEVAGPIMQVLVTEGAAGDQGHAPGAIDDTIQRATVDQQSAQADAA